VRRVFHFTRFLALGLGTFVAAVRAEPMAFNLPVQAADVALLALSRQAHIEVLFSFDDLHRQTATVVVGRFEPAEALQRLLRGTGYAAQATSPGKFAVTRVGKPTTSIGGRLLAPDGTGARGVRVELPAAHLWRSTDENGEFFFPSVPPGVYELVASASGVQTLQLTDLNATADAPLVIPPHRLQTGAEPERLAPFVVEGTADRPGWLVSHPATFPPRTAVGNLDLARTEHDAIPFIILDREHIRRSGVVNLNEFLQRELIESDATSRPPEQDGSLSSFVVGSSNLGLRGFEDADETIILINGRRLPEVYTSGSDPTSIGRPRMPDVNFIPLSLVQQVEVLPISASSLYNGNPVGGVINIVLRPGVDANSTEVTATYNNATRGFDAPQSSLSLLHSESLLGGALRLRLNASTTQSMPATESELGFHQRNATVPTSLAASIFRATPNLHSADLSPLFGPGSSPVTSVAPGADGSGGLATFANRQGVRDLNFFKSPGGMAASVDSTDYPYGRQQQRNVYFASVVYDVTPWLQLGLDGTYASTVVHRGYDVLATDLSIAADSPLNPFKQDVVVSLNETARNLGQNYGEARLQFSSLVLGALVKLPGAWRLSLDAQYAHNVTKYRGLYAADSTRWQQLVDTGVYNPLRDTQAFGPPAAFYDHVLIYRGARGSFVTLGDYETLDAAFRATNEALRLPTGDATLNLGGDYRRSHLAAYHEEYRYGDGSLAYDPTDWGDRVLQRYSVFGELRAPIVPARWLPSPLRKIDADLAVRYIGANSSKESYIAPTLGLKADFAEGFSFRGSVTTSSRYPTPQLNRQVFAPPTGEVVIPYTEQIDDPLRPGEKYSVNVNQALNPGLLPESAITQAAGFLFQRGKVHRVRATFDFIDTHKTNEELFLGSQSLVELEKLFPDRVTRAPLAPGDTHSAGVVTSVLTGTTNLAWRHSQNWNASADYAWSECRGGTLEFYGRLLYYELYKRQILPSSLPVDELSHPDGAAGSNLLRYRANFGAGWSNRDFGFGIDGRYFSPRVLPVPEREAQGHDRIRPAWQFDTYLESDVGRWLPWDQSRHGLRAQLRVNNVFGDRFPKYVNESSGAGVQPYGDWRGRTYSLSLTANF
jgi:iron complex outermembrane receptor protein